MAQGKHLFQSSVAQAVPRPETGLKGRWQKAIFQDEDINLNYEIDHDVRSQQIGAIASMLDGITRSVLEAATAGVLTIGAATGIGLVVGVVAFSITKLMSSLDLFNSCAKATYDQDTTQRHMENISNVVKPHLGNVAHQKSTSNIQDEKIVEEMMKTLRILGCFRTFYTEEANKNWSSSCSERNTKNILDYVTRLENNFLSKIRKLTPFYQVIIKEFEVDFQGSGRPIADYCKVYPTKGIIKMVNLIRLDDQQSTLVDFGDFAVTDNGDLKGLYSLLEAHGIEFLQEQGKKINQVWLSKGCAEVVHNKRTICLTIDPDDLARGKLPQANPISEENYLLEALKKYYTNDPSVPFAKIQELMQKAKDEQMASVFNGWSWQTTFEKTELVCWLKTELPSRYQAIKEQVTKHLFSRPTEREQAEKFIERACASEQYNYDHIPLNDDYNLCVYLDTILKTNELDYIISKKSEELVFECIKNRNAYTFFNYRLSKKNGEYEQKQGFAFMCHLKTRYASLYNRLVDFTRNKIAQGQYAKDSHLSLRQQMEKQAVQKSNFARLINDFEKDCTQLNPRNPAQGSSNTPVVEPPVKNEPPAKVEPTPVNPAQGSSNTPVVEPPVKNEPPAKVETTIVDLPSSSKKGSFWWVLLLLPVAYVISRKNNPKKEK